MIVDCELEASAAGEGAARGSGSGVSAVIGRRR
jgi:hypothetical protein